MVGKTEPTDSRNSPATLGSHPQGHAFQLPPGEDAAACWGGLLAGSFISWPVKVGRRGETGKPGVWEVNPRRGRLVPI